MTDQATNQTNPTNNPTGLPTIDVKVAGRDYQGVVNFLGRKATQDVGKAEAFVYFGDVAVGELGDVVEYRGSFYYGFVSVTLDRDTFKALDVETRYFRKRDAKWGSDALSKILAPQVATGVENVAKANPELVEGAIRQQAADAADSLEEDIAAVRLMLEVLAKHYEAARATELGDDRPYERYPFSNHSGLLYANGVLVPRIDIPAEYQVRPYVIHAREMQRTERGK